MIVPKIEIMRNELSSARISLELSDVHGIAFRSLDTGLIGKFVKLGIAWVKLFPSRSTTKTPDGLL